MKLETWYKEKLQKFRDDVDFLTEAAILDFTEKVVDKMQLNGLSRAELAQKLGVSKPFVTKLLNGSPNMTIKTMVSIAHALECEFSAELCPKGFEIRRVFSVPKKISVDKYTELVRPVVGEVNDASAA
jgi:transcriptional regulator with XRE-family HTH domain